MFSNKIKITLTLGIILLLSVVSVAQAAPPLQGPSGTSQGHTLDLDPAGNNLGAVMKGSNAEDSASDNDEQNHVAVALADYFGEMSYEEIMALHESGVGFGNIARGLYFTTEFDLGIGAADLVAEAGQSGWGKTLRDNGVHPGSLGKGRGNQPEHAKAHANNGQGNGNGNGNGNNGHGNGNNVHGQGNNGQGHGKNKNKDGSDVADPDVDSDEGDDAVDTDVDSEDNDTNDDASNNDGRGKGKGNNGQGQGKGNNGKGNGKSKGNGNSQSHGNDSNSDNNGQNNSDGN